ncbi:MAG: hypothetical protein AB8F95_08585 [Bacteroidia bacterium]
MPNRTQSPFEELLVLARKVKTHYFNPEEEERISILKKVILLSGLGAFIVAILTGMPTQVEKMLDPNGDVDGLYIVKSYLDTFMILFGIHITGCTCAMGIALVLGVFPFKKNWSLSMRIKWLGLWLMTLWGLLLVVFALTWKYWEIF